MHVDRALLERLARHVVGRARELEVVVAALAAGRHMLLEGPPGTGKSTLLRAVAHELGIGFELVEGNAELTPARLIGHFDPARVLSDGYVPDVWIDGPLASALRDGSLLYVEEINRIPEETLNVLITVMSEGELHVPRLGRIGAASTFRLVAAMNPFDAVGTARISAAVYDRTCRLSMDYQSAAEEEAVVRQATAVRQGTAAGQGTAVRQGTAAGLPEPEPGWLAKVVELVRRTRTHPDVRIGSSVRGAIDLVLVAGSLAELRAEPLTDDAVGLDAALVALSGRIRVREGSARAAEDIIRELWLAVFGPPSEAPKGKADAPSATASL